MKMHHDSRMPEYRSPFGAVEPGTPIRLSIDVWAIPNAIATLRIWVDNGEKLIVMRTAEVDGDRTRFEATLTPEADGTIWYHFIIAEPGGRTWRYGAQDGLVGGVGDVRDWEPPSFQITVQSIEPFPPAWYGPAGAYLSGRKGPLDPVETFETFHEQYPAALYPDAFPWPLANPDCTFSVWEDDAAGAELPPAENDLICFTLDEDVCGFWCRSQEGATLCALFNTSFDKPCNICVPLVDEDVSELVAGYGLEVVDASEDDDLPTLEIAGAERFVKVGLGQLGWALLHFHKRQRLQRPLEPGLGVLAHITSLPAVAGARADEADSLGATTGADAASSLDAEANVDGNNYIDDLFAINSTACAPHPLDADAFAENNAPDALASTTGESLTCETDAASPLKPKSATKASAPGTLGAEAWSFVDWLADEGVRYWQVLPVSPTDEYGSPYAGISAFAGNDRLLDAQGVLDATDLNDPNLYEEFERFCQRESDWLEPYASFMAIRQKMGEGAVWQEWPEEYRHFDASVIEADPGLSRAADDCRLAQFAFDRRWRELRAYANERGVLVIGDMPIYVSADSADVWANPQFFQLDADGLPEVVAGCPPDAFAKDGQVWGNPVYDWEALGKDGFSWWLRRLERAFQLYDVLRLDHFIGFSRYFAIPADEKASAGAYHPGPGFELFEHAFESFGPLPIIAEDLGLITPSVRSLTSSCGFPGMDIAQFVDGNNPLAAYVPRPEKIAYTGTHDNQTLVGYCQDRYPEHDAVDAAQDIARKVAECAAPVAILPLQDLAGLDDEARMNVPGVAEGNWMWRADAADLDDAADFTRELVELRQARSPEP